MTDEQDFGHGYLTGAFDKLQKHLKHDGQDDCSLCEGVDPLYQDDAVEDGLDYED